jgi:hypothetical protein
VLNNHLAVNATSATLNDNVDWAPGNKLVVGPSDWYGVDEALPNAVQSVQGNTLTLAKLHQVPLGQVAVCDQQRHEPDA